MPSQLRDAVYVKSVSIENREQVRGYDFNKGLNYDEVFKTYRHTGFQATALGNAIDEVNKMIRWRLSDEPIADDEQDEYKDMEKRKNTKCKIFLGMTSNMGSCGMREYIRYLC